MILDILDSLSYVMIFPFLINLVMLLFHNISIKHEIGILLSINTDNSCG